MEDTYANPDNKPEFVAADTVMLLESSDPLIREYGQDIKEIEDQLRSLKNE